jgi:hypothetical protein
VSPARAAHSRTYYTSHRSESEAPSQQYRTPGQYSAGCLSFAGAVVSLAYFTACG